MSVETLNSPLPLPPKAPTRLTAAEIVDGVQSVLFYGIIGLGISLPFILGSFGGLLSS